MGFFDDIKARIFDAPPMRQFPPLLRPRSHPPRWRPSISFGIGNQPARPQPPQPQPQPPQSADKACFYTGFHFSGQSACVNIGASSTVLIPGWDNEIESVKIIGTGKVEICRDPNFGGGFVVYASSQSSLPPSYANYVSSYQTYY